MNEKLLKYPKTKMFQVIDTIGIPHPYCITPKHLQGDGMILDIERAEKQFGAVCDICKKRNKKFGDPILDFSEHKQALLIEVDSDQELKKVKGLQEYLISIKEMCEADGYVGFAFKQKKIV